MKAIMLMFDSLNRRRTLRVLASFTDQRLESLPDVPAITEAYPAFAPFFPWGSFYTVCAPKGTPADVLSTLADTFSAAYQDADFQAYMQTNEITPLGLTGDAARTYIANYRKAVVSALIQAGTIDKSLEELGIT